MFSIWVRQEMQSITIKQLVVQLDRVVLASLLSILIQQR
jgi:hypothetical protein